MSGLAGILRFDGGPVDPRRLERMRERLLPRGGDAVGAWSEGRVGLVHRALWTTREEVNERQPMALPGRPVRAVMDARLDNRGELVGRLGESAAAVGGDARLVLHAWERWGEGCFDRLVGDFSIALWDAVQDRLVLARDPLGLRSLFYAEGEGELVFASSLGAVLEGLGGEPPLDEGVVEGLLRGSFEPWTCRTVYRGVRRLPPGHLLSVGREVPAPRLHHRMGSTFEPGPRADADWIEGFRRLFEQAVGTRLRAPGPVGVLTGGGLDSAAIACTAARLARERGGEVRLYGLGFERAAAADEREFFRHAAEYCAGVPQRLIPADDLWALRRWDEPDYPLDEPEVYLLRSHTQALFEAAAADGCRVVLAGEGGNQVIGEVYSVVELLARLGPRQLLAELRHFRGGRSVGALLARVATHRTLPRRVLARLRRRRRRPWVRRRASERGPACDLAEEYYGDPGLPHQGRVVARLLRRPYDLARLAGVEVAAAAAGVEWRLPFLDRRLVDCLLHLPWRLRAFRGTDRVILREAMRGRMPEPLRRRVSQSHFQELVELGLRAEGPAIRKLLDKPLAVELGFCSSDPLSRAADGLSRGTAGGELYTFLCLEAWLRRRRHIGGGRQQADDS